MKYEIGKLLDSVGLLTPAFRLSERLKTLTARHKYKNLPPPHLLILVIGKPDYDWFLKKGKLGYEVIVNTFKKHGISLKGKKILDFGCGCGRIIRYFKESQYGCDYNPKLIRWCKENLKGEFKVNKLAPPLEYENEMFDIVYASSVFTHFTEKLSLAWIDEMARVIKKGGYLFFTAHGKYFDYKLDTKEKEILGKRGVVVKYGKEEGMNICISFYRPRFVKTFKHFEIIDFIEEGGKGNNNQDVYVLKRV